MTTRISERYFKLIFVLELQNETISLNIWIYIFTRSSKDPFKHHHYCDSFVKHSIGKNEKDLYVSPKVTITLIAWLTRHFPPQFYNWIQRLTTLASFKGFPSLLTILPFKSSSYVRFKHHSKLCNRVRGDHLRQRRCLTKFSTVNLQINNGIVIAVDFTSQLTLGYNSEIKPRFYRILFQFNKITRAISFLKMSYWTWPDNWH